MLVLASVFAPPAPPPWEGMHVLIVHLPVGLLVTAPLLILLGLLPRIGRYFRSAALLLLVLGTAGAFLAVSSGEAAAPYALRAPGMREVLEEHEELGEAVRTAVTILTIAYAFFVYLPIALKRFAAKRARLLAGVSVGGQALVLVGVVLAGLALANTAHLGGRLVHEFGVHAILSR